MDRWTNRHDEQSRADPMNPSSKSGTSFRSRKALLESFVRAIFGPIRQAKFIISSSCGLMSLGCATSILFQVLNIATPKNHVIGFDGLGGFRDRVPIVEELLRTIPVRLRSGGRWLGPHRDRWHDGDPHWTRARYISKPMFAGGSALTELLPSRQSLRAPCLTIATQVS
jgi:hypothetical protein